MSQVKLNNGSSDSFVPSSAKLDKSCGLKFKKMILALKEHLDELKDDELRTFQWHLTHVKLEWGPIPWSKLETASRETTVDEMVQTYGEDGAVEMMVSVLKMMRRNEQASKLSHAKRSSNESLLELLSSAVEKTHRDANWSMDLSHSTFNFNGPLTLDSSCLTSSDRFCQKCGPKVESPQVAPNPEPPIQSLQIRQGKLVPTKTKFRFIHEPTPIVDLYIPERYSRTSQDQRYQSPIKTFGTEGPQYQSTMEPQILSQLISEISTPIYH